MLKLKSTLSGAFKLFKVWIRVPVKFLTEFSYTPALAVLAFAFGKTRTSLRASNPVGSKAVCFLNRKLKSTLSGAFKFSGSTGFEPAISALTGQRVNQATP